jgi:hypothetical protein
MQRMMHLRTQKRVQAPKSGRKLLLGYATKAENAVK